MVIRIHLGYCFLKVIKSFFHSVAFPLYFSEFLAALDINRPGFHTHPEFLSPFSRVLIWQARSSGLWGNDPNSLPWLDHADHCSGKTH